MMGGMTIIHQMDWSTLTPAIVVLCLTQFFTFAASAITYFQSRANGKRTKATETEVLNTKKAVEDNTEASLDIARSVNGHQTALTAQTLMVMKENALLRQKLGIPADEHVAAPDVHALPPAPLSDMDQGE